MLSRSSKLSLRVSDFFAVLRETHAFSIGQREVHDALRALDLLGLSNAARVRAALRAVACASPEQIAIFEEAYDDVFLAADEGAAQAAYRPRHSRPGPPSAAQTATPAEPHAEDPHDRDEDREAGEGPARERRLTEEQNEAVTAWLTMRARVSPTAATGAPPAIEKRGLEAMESAARKLVRSVHLGRERRWTPQPHGPRFDVRRTLRASLQTGGDPAVLHRLGPPRRAPRIVLLVDGSRSMSDNAAVLMQFAYALERATVRARTYAFSTELHDLTRILSAARPGSELPSLGEAWGGGTRIGASLSEFVRDHAARMLDHQTLVIVASDGLDAGDVPQLERAMREIRRRSAGVVWLNPHARARGFAPTAAGMRSALPFIDVLDTISDAADVERIATRLARGGRGRA
jgi:uncharacterized protein with von Willebrand factor type A (vWA) domain